MPNRMRYHPHSLPRRLCLGFFPLFFFSIALASKIPLDSKLVVKEDKKWASPNGSFELGFFSLPELSNQYSIGIWFASDSIPASQRAVVWVAGADVTVGCDSYLHLTIDGDLILFDSSKEIVVWTSRTSNSSVDSAHLLESGNLVLLSKDRIIWESFHTPSDTLLPRQPLSSTQALRAASKNSVSSYYSLSLENSRQLKLSWESNVTYWSSANPPLLISQAVLMRDGSLRLLDGHLRPVWSAFAQDHNDLSVGFRFLRLDVDGNLRMYSWVDGFSSWRSVWQAVENQCNVFATCGCRGVCSFAPDGSTVCNCPVLSSLSANSDCLAPYNGRCSDAPPIMLALKKTFLYGIYPPEDYVIQTGADNCRKLCLQDRTCTSATSANDGTGRCLIKRTRFITGYEGLTSSSISYIKVCLDQYPRAMLIGSLHSPPPLASPICSSNCPRLKQPTRLCLLCLVGVSFGTVTSFLMIQLVIGLWLFRRRKFLCKRGIPSRTDLGYRSTGLIVLSYKEILDVTRNFKHQLSANVFKAVLPDNKNVAIRRLNDAVTEVSMDERHFKCAVSAIGGIHHKNLLRLEGYCCEPEGRFLVYQYAKNGSVARWMAEAKLVKRLTWRKRLEICIGVARAMSYLHMGCREFICHGNLKWQNVVLDEELEPKVTEFGLGGVGSGDSRSDGAAELDVAQFGEMVVRLVSGRLEDEGVCHWAYENWAQGHPERVVDARIEGREDAEELERTLRIAFWCIQVDERVRPMMGEVVKVLEGTLPADPPPLPFALQGPSIEPLSLYSNFENDLWPTSVASSWFQLDQSPPQ